MITVPRVVHSGVTRLWMPRQRFVVICGRSIGCSLPNLTHVPTIYPLGVYRKTSSGSAARPGRSGKAQVLDAFEVLLGREVTLRVSFIENLTRSLHGSRNWRKLQDRFDAR